MLFVVLANPQGYKTIEDFAKLVYTMFSNSMMILSNPQGSAIQNGIPILSRIALQSSRTFGVISNLSELLEVFPNIAKVYFVDILSNSFPVKQLEEAIREIDYKNNDIAIVFAESSSRELHEVKAFSKNIATVIDTGSLKSLTLSSKASIILYKIKEIHEGNSTL